MAKENATNFTIEGRMSEMADIQRNWMWNLLIPGIKSVAPQASAETEDLIVRCRSFSIPPRSNTPTESDFMGMKQYFPGKPTVGGTIQATFEETEDMKIAQIFYEWQQRIFNISPKPDISAGKSLGDKKRTLAKDIILAMYSYDGKELPKKIKFTNAWVQAVDAVTLDYSTGAAVQYTVTFQFDFWTLFPDTVFGA